MATAAANGIIAATAVSSAEQGRVRRAGDRVGDAHDHALAEPDQHQPVHRAVHGGDHLPADALAARAERAPAGDQQLRRHRSPSRNRKNSVMMLNANSVLRCAT